ncbi:MAG: carbon-monoxide dehydrogenase medium subunit [Candidatus Frackibacter sp. T328-2]|nr:MAG: carbon-monoxide dehydrogenase medium subunit [Candidatus Frackibacter sp. T328-2]
MIKNFEYFKPVSVEEVCSLLKAHGKNAKVLAGGTDLIVAMQEKGLEPKYVVDIKALEGIDKITYDEGKEILRIGAATKLNMIAESGLVREHWEILANAARTVGSYQIRNRATIGGNVCNASPSADTLTSLLALGAEIKIVGVTGCRSVPAEEFFVGPGQTILEDGEIVTEIQISKPKVNQAGKYVKHSRRKAVDLAIIGVAVVGQKDNSGYNFKVALGAVAPTPFRATEVEEVLNTDEVTDELIDEAAKKAAELVSPITDLRGTKEYRVKMIEVQTRRALEEVVDKLG